MDEIGIGTELWCHDYRSNRRPWFKQAVTGQTRLSWIVGRCKINKKTMQENLGQWGNRQWFTEAAKARRDWIATNRPQIAGLVSAERDIDRLKQIAVVLGLSLPPPSPPTPEQSS
jgi:hypothetical protein